MNDVPPAAGCDVPRQATGSVDTPTVDHDPWVRVGTSGWAYPRWRGDFYPDGLAQRSELAYLAERTSSVEVNASFYSLRRPSLYASWRDQTPPDFELAVKGGRFITHMKRLTGAETALANFFASGVLALGEKLGPVLWQLPETFHFDAEVLDRFLGLLPRTTGEAAALASRHDDKVPHALTTCEVDLPLRHALEPRSETFDTPEAAALLRDAGVACVIADAAGRWPVLDADTADFRYVRLHGHEALYGSQYGSTLLDDWAQRCLTWARDKDVYVYFDNDARGHAPHDAVGLLQRLGRAATPAAGA